MPNLHYKAYVHLTQMADRLGTSTTRWCSELDWTIGLKRF